MDNFPMLSEKRKRELREKSKGLTLPLPPSVSCRKETLNGQGVYMFRHKELGDIGRLFILPHEGQSQFVYEVTGDEDDPMTQQRKAIFEPISRDIHAQMAFTLGEGKGTPKPYQIPPQTQTIKAEHITCSHCETLVALIVYAPQATTGASLEDHARMMFSKAKEVNVPTWILGKERDVLVKNQYVSQFLSLKFWPLREPVKYILATEMDDILCPLVEKHCFAGSAAYG